MSSAKITLIGLLNYDPTMFDGLQMPEGIEHDLLVDSILMRGGDYEVIYPNPDFLKQAIASWSKRWYPVITNWQKATTDMEEINPLENYDRYETWNDSSESHSTDTMNGSGSTHGVDTSNSTGNVSGTDTVSAYDSSALVNNTGTSQNNNTNTSSNSDVTSKTDTTSKADTNGKSQHDAHIHGNIGVTTAGAMYREFYDIMSKYGNIYESIATIFLQAFVIPIL
jgi:hypothetical protein